MSKSSLVILLSVLAVVLAACGGDDAEGDGGQAEATSTTAAADAPVDADELAGDLAEGLEDLQESVGGGGATLTVGDMTWTFDSVLCAFGEEMIGQEGAVFNLSSIQDGMQFYASIDSFGHSVSLDDITNFENPSVQLSTFGLGDQGEFIVLDGKHMSGSAMFVDGTSDSFEGIDGTFEADCP